MTRLPIPVHVGSEPPDYWDDIEARQRQCAVEAAPWLQKRRRPAIASPTLDRAALGFEPRWVGFDTAECAVALRPSIFAGHGAYEFDRFRQGAASRGETALVISPIGDLEDKPRGVLSSTTTLSQSARATQASAADQLAEVRGCGLPRISETPSERRPRWYRNG